MGNDNVTLLKVGNGTATINDGSFTGSDMRFKNYRAFKKEIWVTVD